MPKLSAATRKLLNAAAKLYWTFGPWDELSTDTPFGIKETKSGDLACALVLGAAGEQFGLALYLGAEGFRTARRMNSGEMDNDEFAYGADTLTLCFGPLEDIPKSRRKEWGALTPLEEDGAWNLPTAMRKTPGAPARTPDDREGRFLVAALESTVALVRSRKLSDRKLRKTTSMPVFVVGGEGELLGEEAEPPALPTTPLKSLEIPAGIRAALGSRPAKGQLMVGLMTAPLAVQDQQTRVLLIVDPESGQVLKAEALLGPGLVETAALRLLDWLAGQRPSPEGAPAPLPAELITDSLELYALLKDILPGFGIKFLGMEGVPQLDEVKQSLRDFSTGPRRTRR